MKNKITVIHHSADFDGLFCREIARKFLPPETEFIGWDYRDERIPFPSEGTVYVLDLSPECFESIPKYQERLIWIDHHKSAIEKFPQVLPGYRIDGVAACRLAWQWFSIQSKMENEQLPCSDGLPDLFDFKDRRVVEPLAVRLAGEYDIWDKRDPNAETFQFGLRSRELRDSDWGMLLDGQSYQGSQKVELIESLLRDGGLLEKYQQRSDKDTMPRAFLIEFEGLKFLTLNTARCNSLTFASKDLPETGHDALMAFYFDGVKWNVSMYHANHRKDLDLSLIASKQVYNGKSGGGHRGACGFQCQKLPFNT